jgi:hypothetical protein
MAEDVRSAQASWSRLGPVPAKPVGNWPIGSIGACSRFFDQFRRHMPQQEPVARHGRPVGAR